MSDVAGPAEPDVTYPFGHDHTAAKGARKAVMRIFPEDGPIADDVALAASELVTNVVLHTQDGGRLDAWDRDRFDSR